MLTARRGRIFAGLRALHIRKLLILNGSEPAGRCNPGDELKTTGFSIVFLVALLYPHQSECCRQRLLVHFLSFIFARPVQDRVGDLSHDNEDITMPG